LQISNLKNYNSKIKSIEEWLKGHIHRYGSTYTLQDLLKINNIRFDPTVNLKYLEEKYGKMYGFKK